MWTDSSSAADECGVFFFLRRFAGGGLGGALGWPEVFGRGSPPRGLTGGAAKLSDSTLRTPASTGGVAAVAQGLGSSSKKQGTSTVMLGPSAGVLGRVSPPVPVSDGESE